MNHPVKWPAHFPAANDAKQVIVSAELVPVDSAEPWRTVTFTTFTKSWAMRLVDECSAALSAPLLWVGSRDEDEEPPRTEVVPIVASTFEVQELAAQMDDKLKMLMAKLRARSQHLVVASGPRTFIVNLAFRTENVEYATETVDTVKADTQKPNRRIRDEF